MEMSLPVTEGLVAEFAAREQVPLLDELITADHFSFDRYLMQSLRLSPFSSEVIDRQSRYHALPASHRTTKVESFTGKTTVCIHQNAPFQPGSPISLNHQLRSLPALSYPMQMDPAAEITLAPRPQAQITMLVVSSISMKNPPIVREWKGPL